MWISIDFHVIRIFEFFRLVYNMPMHNEYVQHDKCLFYCTPKNDAFIIAMTVATCKTQNKKV